MMSLAAIEDLAREQARIAARENRKPFVVEAEDLAHWKAQLDAGRLPRLPFPNLGDHRPYGWEIEPEREYTCDSLGGDGDGVVGGIRDLIRNHLTVGRAYAIVWEAQFCLGIGEFRKATPAERHARRVAEAEDLAQRKADREAARVQAVADKAAERKAAERAKQAALVRKAEGLDPAFAKRLADTLGL